MSIEDGRCNFHFSLCDYSSITVYLSLSALSSPASPFFFSIPASTCIFHQLMSAFLWFSSPLFSDSFPPLNILFQLFIVPVSAPSSKLFSSSYFLSLDFSWSPLHPCFPPSSYLPVCHLKLYVLIFIHLPPLPSCLFHLSLSLLVPSFILLRPSSHLPSTPPFFSSSFYFHHHHPIQVGLHPLNLGVWLLSAAC